MNEVEIVIAEDAVYIATNGAFFESLIDRDESESKEAFWTTFVTPTTLYYVKHGKNIAKKINYLLYHQQIKKPIVDADD